MAHYNNERPHLASLFSTSGKFCYGKTPMQTFKDSRRLAIEKSNEILYLENISDGHNLNDNQMVV